MEHRWGRTIEGYECILLERLAIEVIGRVRVDPKCRHVHNPQASRIHPRRRAEKRTKQAQ